MLKDQAGDGTAGAVADKAAAGMERTAQYLRDRGTAEMWDDVEAYVRVHPVQGIAGAVAAGFIVGRILR